MGKNRLDQRLVYLALRSIFKGADARVRKSKKIHELIQKHHHQHGISNLLEEHNMDMICNVAKTLLEQQVFESILRAKSRFPGVSENFQSQGEGQTTPSSLAPSTETGATRGVIGGRHDIAAVNEDGDSVHRITKNKRTPTQSVTKKAPERTCPQVSSTIPSLYPVYLPFSTQHKILVSVQHMLESACYTFGQKKLEFVLEREGLECAEAVELHRWANIFQTQRVDFPKDNLEALGRPLPELLRSMTELRHAAVHRTRLSANSAMQIISDAESFVKLIENDTCIIGISRLRRETETAVKALKAKKGSLELKFTGVEKRLEAQRADLERQKLDAIEDALEEDRAYILSAGANLERALTLPVAAMQGRVAMEYELALEADIEEHACKAETGN
ncbi:hypothetical protein AA0119_g13109 [Alternaria tenuissima]|uniref:Ubiquinol-cytochrome-c reductase cytochrome c1 n=2 Tax=Alternaria alternata complex TaxID=187734 RepID=A0A4Q4MXY0_ALTAL|nr:hypothetical protein AA0117_g12908 [Alternaria alternata]RYN85799.1 hypothetical protein AA0119_g13109 [Alternaria tenuissima]RYO03527.1 hypothetical protein AA0121_g13082 [Alternaria tenuissima]RYO48067.1 hypothetical protein AA0116_g12921 [Alternaria tenuissima]